MQQWERGPGSVPTITSQNEDRADEANVAAVAAGGTEGADGERSDVSSEVFCPQIDRGDPVAEADLMDYDEFVAEHGACAFAELQQLAANCAVDREMNDAVPSRPRDYFGPDFWRGWDAAERRALAAAGNGPTDDAVCGWSAGF